MFCRNVIFHTDEKKYVSEIIALCSISSMGSVFPSYQQATDKENICETFGNHNLKITIEANKKVVDYLDVRPTH